mmetsp:Transcript_130918/g.226533  ORF Transcript_130918/g.226533 Transcript_130918/m.226533 type:complete len:94 (+) Transcript_130918:602-883(+)
MGTRTTPSPIERKSQWITQKTICYSVLLCPSLKSTELSLTPKLSPGLFPQYLGIQETPCAKQMEQNIKTRKYLQVQSNLEVCLGMSMAVGRLV